MDKILQDFEKQRQNMVTYKKICDYGPMSNNVAIQELTDIVVSQHNTITSIIDELQRRK